MSLKRKHSASHSTASPRHRYKGTEDPTDREDILRLTNTPPQTTNYSFHLDNNVLNSPLFRLPRELRDHIYSYLYPPDLCIHVTKIFPVNRIRPSCQKKLTYLHCQSKTSPSFCYSQSQFGASIENDYRWASDALQKEAATAHRDCTDEEDAVIFEVPLVCKLFWGEVEDLLWKRATWSFDRPADFVAFAYSGVAAAKTKRLALYIPFGGWGGRAGAAWVDALIAPTMNRFKNLEGLDLVLQRQASLHSPRMDFQNGVLSKKGRAPTEEFREMNKWLRVLKGRKLKGDKTTVLVVVDWLKTVQRRIWRLQPPQTLYQDTPVQDRLELAKQVMEILLG